MPNKFQCPALGLRWELKEPIKDTKDQFGETYSIMRRPRRYSPSLPQFATAITTTETAMMTGTTTATIGATQTPLVAPADWSIAN